MCAAGEPITIDVTFRNPLKVPLVVRDIVLVCEFFGTGLDTGWDSTTNHESTHLVDVVTAAVTKTLAPLETATVKLACVPKRQGTLKVLGLRWSLGDEIAPKRGYRAFDVRAPTTRKGSETNCSYVRDVPPAKRLRFAVTPPMPRLVVSLENVPSSLPAGGMALVTLRLRNIGVHSEHCDQLSTHQTSALRARVRLPRGLTPVNAKDVGTSQTENAECQIFAPPSWAEIKPGTEVSCDFVLTASRVGHLNLPVLVAYEPPAPAPASMRFRVARLATGVSVTKSLDVAVYVTNAPLLPAAKLVRLVVRNERLDQGAGVFKIKSVRVVSSAETVETREAEETATRKVRLRPLVRFEKNAPAPAVSGGARWDCVMLAEFCSTEDWDVGENNVDTDATDTVAFGPECDTNSSLGVARRLGGTKSVTKFHDDAGGARDVLFGKNLVIEWERVSDDGSKVTGAHVFMDVGAASAFKNLVRRTQPGTVARVVEQAFAASESRRKRDTIRWTLSGASNVSLPDGEHSTVVVPINITVFNPSSVVTKVSFEATTSSGCYDDGSNHENANGWSGSVGDGTPNTLTGVTHATESHPSNQANPLSAGLSPGRPWAWVGVTIKTVTVAPGACQTFDATLVAFTPGDFSVNEYRLVTEARYVGDTDPTVQVLHPHSACASPFVLTVEREGSTNGST